MQFVKRLSSTLIFAARRRACRRNWLAVSILPILAASLLVHWLPRTPAAHAATLAGAAALQQLKTEGSYDSLAAALAAARAQDKTDAVSASTTAASGVILTQKQKLTAADGVAGIDFGSAVALSGNTAVISADSDDGPSNVKGSAYVFVRNGTSWLLQQKLTASDGFVGDNFGIAVALNGDTIVVGAPDATNGTTLRQGAVYVFTRSGTLWTQQQKLTANDGQAFANFGIAVALSESTLIVGTPRAVNGSQALRGAAYVFTRNGALWAQQQKLAAADGPNPDAFGNAVALSGDTLVVGAPSDTVGTNGNQGLAYVFTRGAGQTGWTQQQRLVAGDGAANDVFGSAVTISGDTIAVSAPSFDFTGAGDDGLVYVFVRSGGVWSLQAPLHAADFITGANFGRAVALSGDTLVIGAPGHPVGGNARQGAAYVFSRNGIAWRQQRQLTANDGAANDIFGNTVALNGDTVLAGAVLADIGAHNDQGAAYVFTICANNFAQQQQFTSNDGAAGDFFGNAIALSAETLVVGAPFKASGTKIEQGAAYIFIRNSAGWALQQKLTANDGAVRDWFGYAVALSGDTVVVGALRAQIGANVFQGAAYVFSRNGAVWTQQQKLVADDGASFDAFGQAVALSGDTAVIGAPSSVSGNNARRGAVYVFTRSGGVWSKRQKLFLTVIPADSQFGWAVALSANTLLIGAPNVTVGTNTSQGAAYVYTLGSGAWRIQQELLANDGAALNQFGNAVALSGDTALVGAPYGSIGTNLRQGAAYVFTRTGELWSQQKKLSASQGAANDFFGHAVALNGDTAVVGAYRNNDPASGVKQGAAYVFTRGGIFWTQLQQLLANDGAALDDFGYAVALSGDTILASAPVTNVGANNLQGAAYTYVCAACPAITLAPAALPNATQGAAYNQTFTASSVGGGMGTMQFTLSDGALPPGLTLAQSGLLAGTPTAAGAYRFTITATTLESLCPGSQSYTLTVTPPCQPITLNPASLSAGQAGVAYSQQLSGSGGATPYGFAVTAGALPNGLTLTASSGGGLLSGTPTVSGTFSFTARATDANGCQGTRAYTLTLAAACPNLTLNPATLPNGAVGVAYSQTLTATGGSAPYSFALSNGALPNGVQLAANGQLAGTPTQSSVSNFTVAVTDANACGGAKSFTLTVNPPPQVKAKKGDFDGDGKADLAVWTGATGTWTVVKSTGGTQTTQWGASYSPYFDVIVPGDYDGDGKQDHAIWRGQDSLWYIKKSGDGQALTLLWGANYAPYFDVPTPGDFDGDGKTDMAVWRPSDGSFYVKRSSNQTNLVVTWGQPGDIPVAADYDGDGKTDCAVWRPSTGEWLIQKSSGGTQTIAWGAGYAPYFDVPVVADYDGDGKADPAIWRGQDSLWYIKQSGNGQPLVQLWGANYAPYFDVPVPADYDGDGKADIAVWRPADGTWYIKRSSNNTNFVQAHGQQGDTPVLAHGVK